ncbi:porin [Bacteroidia bacterium]|nr:porin [Bacteroidia bacterium]
MINYGIMKIKLLLLSGLFSVSAFAQEAGDKYIESDVIPLAGKKGFSFETRAGDFVFKPFVLVQTSAKVNYYDDEGLELSDQDNIANSGFEIGNALLGFAGKAFGKLTFNMTLNAAQSGDALLQQAWFDLNLKDELRFRFGKFKTPYNQAYLVTLGETLFPALPVSLTAPVNIPYSLNSVNPNVATGFDLGVQVHGLLARKWEYRVGVFNGTGIGVNGAKKTLSDDLGVPSLLYAGRIAYMPKGVMPTHQGSPEQLSDSKWLVALSTSYNVEANWQASNDFRAGVEFAYLYRRLYLAAEAYYLNVKFTKRQQIAQPYNFLGGYVQGGYFVSDKAQLAMRYDLYNRNSLKTDGFLNLPALGVNYFIAGYNLKLQAMYQYLGKWGHENQLARDNDDLGLAQHFAQVMLQFSF